MGEVEVDVQVQARQGKQIRIPGMTRITLGPDLL